MCEPINLRHFLFNIVMATVPIASQITASTDEDNRTDSDTNLSVVNSKDELHTNVSTQTPVERKKLQHMMEFHEEYQCVFGEKDFHPNHNEKKNIPYESTYS